MRHMRETALRTSKLGPEPDARFLSWADGDGVRRADDGSGGRRRVGRRARPEGRLQFPDPADPVGQVLQLPRPRPAEPQGRAAARHQGGGLRRRPSRAVAPSCRETSTRASSSAGSRPRMRPSGCRPKSLGRTLSPEEIDLLKRWIEQGAEWKAHWSFLPPVAAPVPEVKDAGWPRNPIDRFVLARLEAERLTPAPEAEQGAADPPGHLRPHRAAADSRRNRRVPGRHRPRRLRAAGRPPAGFAAVRRADGRRLARPGPLRRHLRLPGRRLSRHVALARLGRPGVQRQPAVRPVHHLATGRRPAAPADPRRRSSPRPSTATIARPTRGEASRKSSASSTSPTGPTPSRPRSWG